MKKSLRRVLERLRAATNGTFGKRTHVRGGLQETQRMQPALVPVRSTLRG
jgi:hypothetical protein